MHQKRLGGGGIRKVRRLLLGDRVRRRVWEKDKTN